MVQLVKIRTKLIKLVISNWLEELKAWNIDFFRKTSYLFIFYNYSLIVITSGEEDSNPNSPHTRDQATRGEDFAGLQTARAPTNHEENNLGMME